jgi:hypothetical protein
LNAIGVYLHDSIVALESVEAVELLLLIAHPSIASEGYIFDLIEAFNLAKNSNPTRLINRQIYIQPQLKDQDRHGDRSENPH